jgi:hypothetical protein
MKSHLLTRFGKVLLLVLLVGIVVFSQTQTKMVEWTKDPISTRSGKGKPPLRLQDQIDGVEIEGLSVDGASVTIGQPFVASDDWIKTIAVRVRNISTEKIAAVQVTFTFPDAGADSPEFVICYGCAKLEKERGVLPGEEVELKSSPDEMYDWVKGRLTEKGSLSRINKAEIRYINVTLPDGTKWFSGCMKTADPKNACPTN